MRAIIICTLVFGVVVLPNSTLAQDWMNEYNSFNEKGDELLEQDRIEYAGDQFRKAFQLALEHSDSSLAANALLRFAKSQYRSENEDQAIQYFKLADGQFGHFYSPSQRGFINNQIGTLFDVKGQPDSSVVWFQQGIDLMKPADDSIQYAQLYRNLAYAYQFLSDYNKSVSMADSALKYTPSANLYAKSRAFLAKYISYLWLGKITEAEPFILESLSIAQKIDNELLQVELYRLLGDYYRRLHDLNKAIIFLRKGLDLAEKMNRPVDIAKYEDLLGRLYLLLEETDQAINLFNNAHLFYEKQGNRSQDAQILHLMGRSFLIREDFEMADELFEEALTIATQYDEQVLAGEISASLADLALMQSDQKTALEYISQTKEIADKNDAFWLLRSYQDRLTKFDEKYISSQEKLAVTKDYYRVALSLQPESRLNALIKLAQAYRDVGSDSAFIYAEAGLEEIEYRRFSLNGSSLKAGAFSDYATFFNEVGSWYAADNKNLDHAFELFERAKSRALLDQLAIKQQASLTISEKDEIQLLELQKRIDQLYRAQENASGLNDQAEITNQIAQLQMEYDAKLEEILLSYPEWKNVKTPDVLKLDEVQKLTDNETAILEYAFTRNGLSLMLITKEEVHYQLLDGDGFSREKLNKQIDTFRNSIINLDPEDQIATYAKPLYDQLIGPLDPYLDRITKLVIVPDSELNLLPFDALISDNAYLVERFTIKFIPSIGVYNLIPETGRNKSDFILGLAGSGFEAGDGIFVENSAQSSFATLPYTLIEVDSVSDHFEHSDILRNDEVTEAALKQLDLEKYQFIHFATHGAINEAAPSQSGLILSKKIQLENLFGEDGYLNANEITDLNLAADMVVLSACNTATGKVVNGEGLFGLQRAFLTAGASSVVASLWSIYDRSTPILMGRFYSHIHDFEEQDSGFFDQFLEFVHLKKPDLVDTKAKALREAKLDLLDHPYYKHPVHWASFIITGK